ncbi:MAG: hypothetical protein ACI4HM_09800 [Ruminococcus sp.]
MNENESKMLKQILSGVTYIGKVIKKQSEAKYISKDFASLNSADSFVKAKADSFAIDKLHLSFVHFDRKTKKTMANIDIYMDIDELIYLCEMLKCGVIAKQCSKEIQRAKNANEKYPKAFYKGKLGGISEEKAKKFRNDGLAVSRFFDLSPSVSQNYNYVITGYSGAGKTNQQGLIVPQGKPEKTIRIPVTSKDLKSFFLRSIYEWQAYTTAQYSRGEYYPDYTKGNKGGNQN